MQQMRGVNNISLSYVYRVRKTPTAHIRARMYENSDRKFAMAITMSSPDYLAESKHTYDEIKPLVID